MPKRVLVDTNVALDWLLDRQPWASEAKHMWDSQDAGESQLCLAASVLDTIYFIVRKGRSHDVAKRAVEQCVTVLTILPVDVATIQQALQLTGADFEDNVLIATAMLQGIDLIVTRDPAGFNGSPIPAIDPNDIQQHLAP